MSSGISEAVSTNKFLFAGVSLAALLYLPESWREPIMDQLPAAYEETGLTSVFLEIFQNISESNLFRFIVALTLVFLGLQAQFLLANYADYLPSHLHFRVHFSEGRIQRELESIPVAELERAGIVIPDNWRSLRQDYLAERNKQIQGIEKDCQFRFDNETSGLGTFSFHVLKRGGNIQTYEADTTSFGVVDFHSHCSGTLQVLMARFRLRPDGKEHFNVTRMDALLPLGNDWRDRVRRTLMPSRYVIVRPLFSQMAYESLTKHKNIGTVVALTRVRYFPSVLLTSTIYLVDVLETFETEESVDRVADTPVELHNSTDRPLVPIACGVYDH